MLNKKLIILTTLIISLLAISAVSATDNTTSDVIGINDANEFINSNDDVVSVDAVDDINLDDTISTDNLQKDNLNDNVTNNQDILGCSESDDELSIENDMDVLSAKSSPPSNYYSVFVNSAQVESGGSGTIKINVDCCYYEG